MKALRILLILLVVCLPVAARAAWHYTGVYNPGPIPTPDYASLKLAEPPSGSGQAATITPIAQQGSGPLVLVDGYHSNLFLTAELSPFMRDLLAAGARISIYDGTQLLQDELKKASSFVAILPSSPYTPDEVQTITSFVQRGGRLLTIGDPTRIIINSNSLPLISVTDALNQLTSPFGITYDDNYVYNLKENDSNFRNIILTDFTDSQVTTGLEKVVFYTAMSLQAKDSLIRSNPGTLNTLTAQTDPPVVAASAQGGNVLALGDMTFLTEPYRSIADNARLSANLAAFLAGEGSEKGTPSLAVFPYVFTQPVSIQAIKTPVLSGEDIATFSALQAFFKAQGLEIQVGTSAPKGHDLIVLGTFENADALQVYAGDLKLTMDEDNSGEYPQTIVRVKGLGSYKADETGIIYLNVEKDRTVLVLMASDATNLSALASRLSQAALAGCLIQGNLAICPTSSSGMG